MHKCCCLLLLLVFQQGLGQSFADKLSASIAQLEEDATLKHATIALSVIDSRTGIAVYEHNAQTGLAPASTQKLFTSCAAFDLLGKDYRYSTEIIYKYFNPDPSRSYFIIKPSGDPSFGSARFDSAKSAMILSKIVASVVENKITPVSPQYIFNDSAFAGNNIPGGWLWEDIGNYYGAAAQSLNWMENQYDIILKSGRKIGDDATVVKTKPAGLANTLVVNVKTAAKGTGDNTIVYPEYGSFSTIIEGTIPAGEDSFEVSASLPDPRNIFIQQLNNKMKADKISMFYGFESHPPLLTLPDSLFNIITVYRHMSPTLDSLNYWFLKKSINLYGEAFIKTMALKEYNKATTAKGVEVVKDFWLEHGIEKSAINIIDGSGLSPQNRVTTDALVRVLQYAKSRPWFNSFYYDLPEHNGMKMKSGSIGGARAYAGYNKSKDGKDYTYAIIVNNFDGDAAAVVKKIYKLLDNLK